VISSVRDRACGIARVYTCVPIHTRTRVVLHPPNRHPR